MYAKPVPFASGGAAALAPIRYPVRAQPALPVPPNPPGMPPVPPAPGPEIPPPKPAPGKPPTPGGRLAGAFGLGFS